MWLSCAFLDGAAVWVISNLVYLIHLIPVIFCDAEGLRQASSLT